MHRLFTSQTIKQQITKTNCKTLISAAYKKTVYKSYSHYSEPPDEPRGLLVKPEP